jgi:hypothetical protein
VNTASVVFSNNFSSVKIYCGVLRCIGLKRRSTILKKGGNIMVKNQKRSFDDEQFCEALHHTGHRKAAERLGHYPVGTQMQMNDLLDAFVELKHTDYSSQFGTITGEWNEANRIIQSFLNATKPSIGHALPAQMGFEIGCAIQNWGHFKELPKDMRTTIEKSKETYAHLEESLASHCAHFFNEMKIRLHALSESEKPSIVALINLYQPVLEETCQGPSFDKVHGLLNQFHADLTNLFNGHKEPSRAFKSLLIKTQQDMNHIHAFSTGKGAFSKAGSIRRPEKQTSDTSRIRMERTLSSRRPV